MSSARQSAAKTKVILPRLTVAEQKYRLADAQLQKLGLEMALAAKLAFPVGALVSWESNGHPQSGRVVWHASGWDRWGIEVRVVNERTGKTSRKSSRSLRRLPEAS